MAPPLLVVLLGGAAVGWFGTPSGGAAPAGVGDDTEPGAAVHAAAAGAEFRPPLVGGVRVVTAFDPPAEPWLAGHRGVDLEVAPSATVVAPADGTVAFAGMVAGRPVVSVDHRNGVRTTYEPVDPVVRTGQPVVSGSPLGRIIRVHPGCPVRRCLHWGARWSSGGPSRSDDDYIDPMELLSVDNRPIRLKPTLPGDGSR